MDSTRSIALFTRMKQAAVSSELRLSAAPFRDLPHGIGLDRRDCFLSAADLYSRELTNFINEFTLQLQSLQVWNGVLPDLSDDELIDALVEFVHPAAYFCLGFPHRLKSRAHYAIAHVSHLANEFVEDGWSHIDDLGHSSPVTARAQARRWSSWRALSHSLGELDNNSFRNATADFRNQFEHGLPRSLELGYHNFVRRHGAHGEVITAGSIPPLRLADLLPALVRQHAAALRFHRNFAILIDEQLAASDG